MSVREVRPVSDLDASDAGLEIDIRHAGRMTTIRRVIIDLEERFSTNCCSSATFGSSKGTVPRLIESGFALWEGKGPYRAWPRASKRGAASCACDEDLQQRLFRAELRLASDQPRQLAQARVEPLTGKGTELAFQFENQLAAPHHHGSTRKYTRHGG